MNKRKAAFFDRDGTLIADVSYLSSFDQIHIIPEAMVLCRQLQDLGYQLFVVTNQSGIARGFFDEPFVKKTHEHLQKLFAQEMVLIEDFFYCPHHPTEAVISFYKKDCLCRKPRPGLLHQASDLFSIDLTNSLMFGDKISDVQAGLAAGCRAYFIQDALQWSQKQLFSMVTLLPSRAQAKGETYE